MHIEKVELDRATPEANLALVDTWIAQIVDKLNFYMGENDRLLEEIRAIKIYFRDNPPEEKEDGEIEIPTDYELYGGTYFVTPKAGRSQTLETKDKLLQDNVTVDKVPYYETANREGTTVYIANEV